MCMLIMVIFNIKFRCTLIAMNSQSKFLSKYGVMVGAIVLVNRLPTIQFCPENVITIGFDT